MDISKDLIPALSVDCVIFGFSNNQLKVLLLKIKQVDKWMIPGWWVDKNQNVDDAAHDILKFRTGLDKIFLRQFHFFGNIERNDFKHNQKLIDTGIVREELHEWIMQRFNTVGYYALVDHTRAKLRADNFTDEIGWFSLNELPELVLDHPLIIKKALETLRIQLNYQPIGLNLLPKKFTMPELQCLYETILDKQLDRRNFQRKMLGYNILIRLNEHRSGGAHKAPYLYKFDTQKYNLALKDGLNTGW